MNAPRVLALAVLAAGCDTVLGLDRVETPVTGSVIRRFEYNNAAHVAVVELRPYTVDELPRVEAIVAGVSRPVAWDYPTGTFRFDRPGDAPYRLVFHHAARAAVEVQASVPHLTIPATEFRRPDAVMPATPTFLRGTITPAGSSTKLSSTGVWGELSIPDAPGAYDIEWPSFLLSASKHDRLYATRFAAAPNSMVIDSFDTVDLEMTEGANSVDLALTQIVRPWCAHVRFDRATEAARVKVLYPTHDSAHYTAWGLYSTPNADLGPTVLFSVAFGVGAVDETDVGYATPFPGFTTLLNMAVQSNHEITTPVIATLYAGTTNFLRIEDTVTCEPYSIPPATVAVPYGARLGDIALDTDGMTVELGDEPELTLTWEVDGPVDSHLIRIRDLSTPTRIVRSYLIATPSIVVETSLFETGHVYAVELNASRGAPGAGDGDFDTKTYPNATGYGTSAVFVIAR